MRFYLSCVAFGLLMFGLCVVLQPQLLPQPRVAMDSLFGVHRDATAQPACTLDEALPA